MASSVVVVVPAHPGAVIVDIDFDQDGQRCSRVSAMRSNGFRRFDGIENDFQVDPAFAQPRHPPRVSAD